MDAHLSAFARPAEGSGGAGALLPNKDRATRGGVRLSLPDRRRSIALSALDLFKGPR
jgi:hypothetical protein